MKSHGMHVLEYMESEYNKLAQNLEIYVEPQSEKVQKFKELIQKSYVTALNVNKNDKGRFLPKLIFDKYDSELIFEQCEILSNAALPKLSQNVSYLKPRDIANALSKTRRYHVSAIDINDKIPVEDHESVAEDDFDSFDDSDSLLQNKIDMNENSTVKQRGKFYHSEVDDEFFKLSELEEFLKIEDLKEKRKDDQDYDSDIDDGIDLFQDIPSDDDKDSEEEKIESIKIRKQIQEIEKSLLEPLPWHLTGEVEASKRPTDSLIHKDTDFDSNFKRDFLVDNTFNEKIENITIMAIRNEAFNDVERKIKPMKDVIAYKTTVALEQTKSKKGLAEIYEEEYLKKQNKQQEENPEHKEIKEVMDNVFPELYALFSHIPVPAVPEFKIVSNLPAVIVEEVAPTKVSDAALLAPEEVKEKSGLIKSQTERSETDRKRERRKKKIHQKLKEKKMLKKLELLKGNPSKKVTKLEKMQALKKIKQHKNTKIAAVDASLKIKSSKDFFSRIQETVAKNKSKHVSASRKRNN